MPPVHTSDIFISSSFEQFPDDTKPNKIVCRGKVPCYKQHTNDYARLTRWDEEERITIPAKIDYNCQSGCVPVAIAIIFGYHAKQHGKNNIFLQRSSSSVPIENDQQVEYTVDMLRGIMGTFCNVKKTKTELSQMTQEEINNLSKP